MFRAGTLCCILIISTRHFLNVVEAYTPAIPITELLRRSGQDPNLFKVKMNPDSERFPEDDDDQIKDYEELNEIRNSIYPFKARNENSDVTDLFTSFLDRTAIQEIMNHIKKMLYCGPQGWCGFTCCPRSRQWTFTPQPLALSFGRRRFKPKRCTLACMPHCTTQCLLYQAYRPNPDTTMQIQYPPKALVEATNPQPIPLCRPSCMPSCLKECLMEPVAICRPACMPQCTPACVNSLPMMIKCPLPEVCICPPGYVQCSEDTCCMRYRTMAIKYSNQMPAYTFDDANVTDANKNETLVFPNDSHELDGQKAYDLKKNGTIIYHPENLTGEIIYDDGEVFVDGTLASAELKNKGRIFLDTSTSNRNVNTTNKNRTTNFVQN